jgi:uncharacterized cupin superfamily protein
MHVRHADITADRFDSPKGRFGALFREPFRGDDTGCPFDIEHVTIPPGKRNFPFHSHGAMWEVYYVLSGNGTMRTDEETVDLQPGDTYICKPGLAHQIINDTDADLIYLVVANEPAHDSCYYPDSGKLAPGWRTIGGGLTEAQRFWKPVEGAEYFDDEE